MATINFNELADFFKVFSDDTRLKILKVLIDEELCVNDIASRLKMSQSAISHQLKFLKQQKAVKMRRDGKENMYSLDDSHVSEILKIGTEHIKH